MDNVANPYRPGAGTRPPILAGRDRELDAFTTLIGRLELGRGERSLVLSGLRGVGKTALLLEYERRALDRDWAAHPIEVRPDLDFRDAIAAALMEALRGLSRPGLRGSVRKAIEQAGERVRSFRLAVREPETGAELSLTLDSPSVATGDLEPDLTALFAEVGKAGAAVGKGIVLLVDEMHLLSEPELEAVCAAMHEQSKRDWPLALAAAGLPPLQTQLLEAKTYAERLFNYIRLEALDETGARAALAEPARTALPEGPEVRYEEAALNHLVERSDRYPYFLQTFGYHAWNEATEPTIALADAKLAVKLGRETLDTDLYAGRWERASKRGKDYLRAIAELGPPAASGEVALHAGFGSAKTASPHRERLIEQGLIYSPERGKVAFTVPGFGDYVLRRR